MKRVILIIAFALGIFSNISLHAIDSQENIEVSVLTCSPGQEVYSLYGHTAIRVKDNINHTDYVFNYGVFDFETEYFVWKFVLGKTDYLCMATPWEYFLKEYRDRGSSVVSQTLNLTDSETLKIKDYLYNNIRRENRTYRYNFLTNNCTTRVMDCVESCIDGDLVYSWQQTPLTYRQILHEYTQAFPWCQEGNDILLGADVDTVLSHRATCFIPEYYMKAIETAVVRNEFQDTRKLVKHTSTILQANPHITTNTHAFPLEPFELGWLAFAICILILFIEFVTKKMLWGLDVILLLAQGLAGCLTTFMFFVSEHPAVDSNWLIGILNPLPLFILPYVTKAAFHDKQSLWHYFLAVWIAAYMLFIPWMPQHLCTLTIPILALLLSRQVSYILHYGRSANKTHNNKKSKKKRKNK